MKKINFTGLVNMAKHLVTRYSSEILVATGIVGMLTTTVIAVKATPKALCLIEEAKAEKGEELTKLETVKAAAKVYIPPMITAATSTACIIGASKINRKRNAALATAYALSEAALNEYKDKVVATIGEKKEREIQDAIAKDNVDNVPLHTRVSYTNYYNGSSSSRNSERSSSCNYDDIIFPSRGDAEVVLDGLNDIIQAYGFASVADLYELANITASNYTYANYGWTEIINVSPARVPEGYILRLPRVTPFMK